MIKNNIVTNTTNVGNTKRKTSRSTLSLTVTKEDHNTTITCQAHNNGHGSPMSTHVVLFVKYAPQVTITVSRPGKATVMEEGDDVEFECQAHANPDDMTYR